jgi:hypothetical protein
MMVRIVGQYMVVMGGCVREVTRWKVILLRKIKRKWL